MPTTKRARQKAARREKIEAQRRAAKRRQLQRRVATIVGVVAVVFIVAALIASGGSNKAATSTTTTTTPGTTTTTSSGTTTTTTAPSTGVTQKQADRLAVAAGCPKSPTASANTLQFPQPAMTISKSSTYYAHVVTTAGTFVIKLEPKLAPVTVNNFVFLASHHFYDCVTFHRVIQGFVVQGGDPTGTGTGGPGYSIKDELPKKGSPTYPLYSVAMANNGNVNTGGSQFFIISGLQGEQLPNLYSLFGQVVSGVSAVKIMDLAAGPPGSGVPPTVIHRMLHVTISSKA